jgi:acetyltransferase-like isoleucine patch superfamily enzyme
MRVNIFLDRLFSLQRILHRRWRLVPSLVTAGRCRNAGAGFFLGRAHSLLGLRYVSVGRNFVCGDDLRLEVFDRHNGYSFTPTVAIGDNFSANHRLHLACINEVRIGNDVLVGSDVFISDHGHGESAEVFTDTPPAARKLYSKGTVYIGDRVWIGSKVSILAGVTIGEGAIVGANSVVSKDVPPYAIVGGIPARVLRAGEKTEKQGLDLT